MRLLLVETNMATNECFWRLAQALSALYPKNSEEKRWVDGFLQGGEFRSILFQTGIRIPDRCREFGFKTKGG